MIQNSHYSNGTRGPEVFYVALLAVLAAVLGADMQVGAESGFGGC